MSSAMDTGIFQSAVAAHHDFLNPAKGPETESVKMGEGGFCAGHACFL